MQRRTVIRLIGYGLRAFAAGGLIVLALVQHRAISRLREENRNLRAEAAERELSRAAAGEAQARGGSETEIQQLREQNRDLLRLRNEVRQLRQNQQEMETLRTANARLLAAIEGVILSSNQLAQVDAARKEGAILGIVSRSADASGRYPGAVVMQLMPESPSAASDLKVGDVVIRIDGRPIQSVGELQAEMLTKKPGETVLLDVMRGDVPVRIPVQTRSWPQ